MYDVGNSESVYKDSIRVRTYEHADAIFSETKKNKLYHYHTGVLAADRNNAGGSELDKISRFFYRMADMGRCEIFQKKIYKDYHYFCRY
jgi:hypothetical protein|tara:strand:+ start:386 stop:652 length:267 start_codon:yes stop_codon:yes gene_type:complete